MKSWTARLTVLFGVLWAGFYACKYYGLGLDVFDTGIYSNLAYNLSRGEGFYSSVLERNHLGEHFSPVMLVFAVLYRFIPAVHWLLGAQLAAWLAVPWILRLVLRESGGRESPGLEAWLSLAWFLYQPVAAAMNFPFHPSTLAMPFVVWAFYEMLRERWVRLGVLLVGLLAFKENLFLVWIGFGLFQLCRRRLTAAVVLIACGALAGSLILGVAIPAFREGEWRHWNRFGPLADWPGKLRYLWFVFAPVAFLPLIRWRAGLVALPALLPNLGSQAAMMYSRRHHYDDVAGALIFCAVAASLPLATQWVGARWGGRGRRWALGVGLLLVLAFADMTPFRAAGRHLPTAESVRLIRELQAFDRGHADDFVYLQNGLGVYFHRTMQAPLYEPVRKVAGRLRPAALVVLSAAADSSEGGVTGEGIAYLASRTNRFERVQTSGTFAAFRVK